MQEFTIKMKRLLMCSFLPALIVGCARQPLEHGSKVARPSDYSANTVVSVSDVKWEKLNPARGDKSPQAGTLWGDRKGAVPTGFLARFIDGFSSPPHIHNATYRAVVISGLIHNDDPGANKMWMPLGSFWTQPKGEVHITAAKGSSNMALVEIDTGPYLVLPPAKAFDSGERPINIDSSNVVWFEANKEDFSSTAPKISNLWGNPQNGQSNGSFVKFPEGFVGTIRAHGSTFRAVVIKGQLQYSAAAVHTLEPGSYFSSDEESIHKIAAREGDVVIYVRTDGRFELLARDQ